MSSMKGLRITSIPYTVMKLDFTKATSCMEDRRDLNLGDKFPRVK